ncbi:hypothetical protein KAFR_0G01250 [Kazachstania africana CBS 2517]|uniref:PDZ GRASP-type domain-containing protein n=1 Tax=Kazachstania africana (strain ATCC 22294 / BCRC 22015 / CBS 2517 / CECT 1963 / NBRC 1671 / NRRL Y-8276) TaxID=1071382 RepID=H2AXQ9_KAZAF|nr:hypothetical protein KAFR_0G01250 [Kazachstania africana CBS 2517]CCF59159.1 hypothetical protein KAFR_0G01250 [Kazachstania africana CBS 2517]
MFRIAKNLVKTFEQSVSSLSGDSNQLDAFFQSIPPNLIIPQLSQQNQQDFNDVVSGLRILWCDEFQLQLQSFFDYIVGINDDPLPLVQNQYGFTYPDYNAIFQILNDSLNSTVKLSIWSAKGGVFRDVYLQVPTKNVNQLEDVSLSTINDNGNQNHTAKLFSDLGFKVQWTPLIASTFTYHVLQLNIPDGPAQQAGLIADEDYIIGCQDGLLATGGETLLQDIVRSRANHDLVLYVYNKTCDCVRPITVRIGPDGRLGCGVGYGFLHRIPTVKQTELSNEQEQPQMPILPPQSSDTFVPQVALPVASSSHKKKKPVTSANNAMSAYFDEGKDQSPKPKSTSHTPSPVAPPPKKSHD